MAPARRIIVGICGASGAIYAQRLLDLLEAAGVETHVVVTNPGRQLLADECGITQLTAPAIIGRDSNHLIFHDNADLYSPLASGSFLTSAMVICPCSAHTLAAMAAGLGDTLLLRSAYVALKQRRRLVLVHRELPLTEIDLENMLKITRAGGVILPAEPSFYLKPQTIADLVDTVVGRTLDLLEVSHHLPIRWLP